MTRFLPTELLTDIALGFVAVAGTVLLSLGSYFATQRLTRDREGRRDMANAMVARIGPPIRAESCF